ncbi:hypothetical protein JCM11251_007539 [Rhodosporidiobolus azoricus]
MDPDVHFYSQHLSDSQDQPTPLPVSVPLPPIQLPSAPRPSLSPSVSRVFQRPANDKAPARMGGLDLSQPNSPAGYGTRGSGTSGGDSLEDEVARTRAARANRLADSSTPSSPSTHISARTPRTDFDPRDSASARSNIQSLVSAGQANLSSSGGSTPSLAMFMGATGQRRVHKVNQGMTEAEREETEKLEKEMEATRAKWGNKGAASGGENGGTPVGGMSLAALMMGGKAPSATAQRAQTLPIDAPSSQTPAEEVEAKAVSRSPPAASATHSSSPSAVSHAQDDFDAPSSPAVAAAPTGSGPSSNTATLTRLRSSSIVAERLRSAEAMAAPSQPSSPALSSGGGDKAENRRSVLDRWGRDEPNLSGVEALKSPPLGGPARSTSPKLEQQDEHKEETREEALNSAASPALIAVANKLEAAPPPVAAEEARAGDGGNLNVPLEKEVEGVKVEEDGVAPKLVHMTQTRARPTKSTPRSLPSAASPSASPAPTEDTATLFQRAQEEKKPDTEEQSRPESGGGYTKPAWSAAPIGVKQPSSSSSSAPSPAIAQNAEEAYEPKYTRGVALPGLSSSPSLRPTPSTAPSRSQTYPQPAPTSNSSPSFASPRPSVKNVASRWGAAMAAQDEEARREKEERARQIKASYGVKVGDAPGSASTSPVKTRSTPLARQEEPKREELKVLQPQTLAKPVPVVQPTPSSAPTSGRVPQPSKTVHTSPPTATSVPTSKETKSRSALLTLLSSAPPTAHLPSPPHTLDLSVFLLNPPPSNPSRHPLEHNFMLFRNEILGVVYRYTLEGEEEVRSKVWVWKGDQAEEGEKTQELIGRLREKTGVREEDVVEVRYRQESPDFGEAFEGQVTVCRGNRDEFDHLAQRIFSVQAHDGVVYVEEAEISCRSLSSAFSTVFSSPSSSPSSVYAWLGEFSPPSERQAACEFAEAIADGREVEVFEEGEESALFWHGLEGLEYASAYYWRYRPDLSPYLRPSVLHFPSSSSDPVLSPSLTLSPIEISLIDAPGYEIWVVIPSLADAKKGTKKEELKRALAAAQEVAGAWKERATGAEGKTPVHVIAFPSLLPRDLPFLSRQLDFSALNAGEQPKKMNVFTVEEAKEEFM